MAGEHDDKQAEAAPAESLATSSGAERGANGVQAVAHVAGSGSAAQVATIVDDYPADRDAIFRWLHARRGNAFVQQVISACGRSRSDDEQVPYRAEMENAFGESFADVKATRGDTAANEGMGARAHAVDDKVSFAEENPSKETVAHELTHVVQHRNQATTGVQMKSAVSSPGDAHEAEADRGSSAVAGGGNVAGQIREQPTAAVSRDVYDVFDILGGGTGAAARTAVSMTGYSHLIEDGTASMAQSPKYLVAIVNAVMKDHWFEFLQTAAALFAAELGVAILVATPDPTMATKVAAIMLQAMLITFAIYAAVEEGPATGYYATKWVEEVKAANGDAKKIDAAAQTFANLLFHVVNSIMAVIGVFGGAVMMERALAMRVSPGKGAGGVAPRTLKAGEDSTTSATATQSTQSNATSGSTSEASSHSDTSSTASNAATDSTTGTTGPRNRDLGLRAETRDALETFENIKRNPVGDVNRDPTKNHYSASRREALGEVVARRPDGRPFSHIRDLQEHYNGLDNVRETLEHEIQHPSPTMTERGLEVLLSKYSELQGVISKLKGFLESIGHGPPFPPFHEWPPGS